MTGVNRRVFSGVLPILTITSVSSVYVRRGSDITDCNMTCPHPDDILELYRECGGQEKRLLELWCDDLWHKIYESRLHLNTSSGCWTLTDAGENDSCVYKILLLKTSGSFWRSTFNVIVLDPGSSPGGSPPLPPGGSSPPPPAGGSSSRVKVGVPVVIIILVSVIFPILLYIKCYKKKKPEDVERNENRDSSEEHGGLTVSSSETDHPEDKEKNLLTRIWRNMKKWRNITQSRSHYNNG